MCQFRVMDGSVSRGDTVVMMNTGKEYTLDEIGVLSPGKTSVSLAAGWEGTQFSLCACRLFVFERSCSVVACCHPPRRR